MAKFNVIQKHRRAAIAEQKRAKHGDPFTNKLKNKNHPLQSISISGKRKRKLFKKLRRVQKEAVENGLVTMQMQDVEMADDDDGTSQVATKQQPHIKFPIKRARKLKARHFKTRRDKKTSSKTDGGVAAAPSTSAMEE